MAATFSSHNGIVEIHYADRQRQHLFLTPIARQAAVYLEIQVSAAVEYSRKFPQFKEELIGGRPSCNVFSTLADGVPKVMIEYGARTKIHRLHPREALTLAKLLRAAADDAERHAGRNSPEPVDDQARRRKQFLSPVICKE